MSTKLDMEAIKRRHAINSATVLIMGVSDQVHNDRRDLIAEVERLTTWRPIADAPKDGTEIRCWCPDIGERVLYFRGGNWCLAGTIDADNYEPTHWRQVSHGPTP